MSFIFIVAVVIEFIADQQQYDFQTEKHRRIKAGEPLGAYEIGFVSTGLWGIVRHPNYAMEQSIWVISICLVSMLRVNGSIGQLAVAYFY